MNEVPVFLTAQDAEKFKHFMRHYDTISELLNANVFETRNGSATLDFGPEGHLMDIKMNIITFKRKKI